jgi:hypothetical protein
MNNVMGAARNFEETISRLLTHSGFSALSKKPSHVDLLVKKNNTTWATEIKYYKTHRAQLTLLSNAAQQIRREMDKNPKLSGMLIVSCIITAGQREHLKQEYRIVVLDRQLLLHLASDSPEITDKLNALFEINPDDLSITVEQYYDLAADISTPPDTERPPPPSADITGTNLCKELRAIKPGKSAWSDYEAKCREILEYLFKDHLSGWKEQQRTDDDLNRFDFVCRIKPSTEFWNFILQHLHSRYILFEFKNYAKPIKQGQVLTTEKYLLEKCLRKVAIMITRKGAQESAIKMTQGAMRETGKLIIILDDEKICKMLHMKQNGSDPTDYLFDITDEFLLSLPR